MPFQNGLRILLGSSICIIYSTGEEFFCSSLKLSCNQETGWLLDCENIEHKDERSQGVFKVCKGFTEIVENLKWVVLGLDVGTGSGHTNIN